MRTYIVHPVNSTGEVNSSLHNSLVNILFMSMSFW